GDDAPPRGGAARRSPRSGEHQGQDGRERRPHRPRRGHRLPGRRLDRPLTRVSMAHEPAMPPVKPRRLRRWATVFLALAVVFVAASGSSASPLPGPRHRTIGPPPADFPFPIADVSGDTADGQRIKGWLVGGGHKGTVVLLHGFAGARRAMLPRARRFR